MVVPCVEIICWKVGLIHSGLSEPETEEQHGGNDGIGCASVVPLCTGGAIIIDDRSFSTSIMIVGYK